MNTGKNLTATVRIMAAAVATIMLGFSLPAHTCGLEPTLKGGFGISYPGSLDVAVAVANARSAGLLPPASLNAIPNKVRLHQIWSHFYMTPGGVLANYHTDGPLPGKTVVLTHSEVLRALLVGRITIEQATELGLMSKSFLPSSRILSDPPIMHT